MSRICFNFASIAFNGLQFADKALIKNNAKVAARVAAAFALDEESTSTVTKKTPTGIPVSKTIS